MHLCTVTSAYGRERQQADPRRVEHHGAEFAPRIMFVHGRLLSLASGTRKPERTTRACVSNQHTAAVSRLRRQAHFLAIFHPSSDFLRSRFDLAHLLMDEPGVKLN